MVSLIIPVYNGENYIKRCLDSLFSTPLGIEVIAVNDGSRDGSLDILLEYERKYSNLKVVNKPQNEGLPQAKKTGLEHASGDYVAFLDVDDWTDPDIYDKMYAKAQESDADMVWCDYVEEYPTRSARIKSVFDKGQSLPISGEDAMRYVHRRQAVFTYPWNKLYRASLLREIDFPHGNCVGEDYYVLIRFLMRAERVDYVESAGYHYVLTENSMSRGGYGPNTLRAAEYYKEDYQMICSLCPEHRRDMTNYLITEYMAFIIAMGRNKTYNKQLIKEVKSFVRRGLCGYVTASYVPLRMKGSALALSVSYRLLIAMYRIIKG